MSIICLFGPDGSGKSTLAKALTKRLSDEGFKVRLSWMRGTHTLASLLARFLSRFDAFRGSDNPYYGITIPGNLRKLWQLLELVSLLPILLTRFLIPSSMSWLVVAERYVPDFLVWIALTTNDPDYLKSFSARLLLAIASKAKVKIYITAEHRKLIKRRRDSNPLFLLRQLELYDRIHKALNSFKLDTTDRSVSESADEVYCLVRGLLGK